MQQIQNSLTRAVVKVPTFSHTTAILKSALPQGHTKKCAQCVQCAHCAPPLPPAQHALANQQDHCVVGAPEFQATGSKDVLACANRFFHLTKLIQILFMVKFGCTH